MPRFAFTLSESQKEWIESESESRSVSSATVLRDLIDTQRGESSVYQVVNQNDTDSDTDVNQSVSPARVDELEQRIAALEAKSHPDNPTNGRESRETPTEPADTHRDPQPAESERRDEQASSKAGSHGPEDWVADHLEPLEFPAGRDRDECITAVTAAHRFVVDEGPASMREIVTNVMPEYPVGYQVPELEKGERYRGSWWRKVVSPGLEALPNLEKPTGGGKWRYTGPE